jgi:Glucodextranase, domain N
LHRDGRLAWTYDRASDGKVALAAEIDPATGQPNLLALGFGQS